MKKRILSVLITLVMLIGLVTVMSISASAATTTSTASGLKCYLDGEVSLDEIKVGHYVKVGVTIEYDQKFEVRVYSHSSNSEYEHTLRNSIGGTSTTTGFWSVWEIKTSGSGKYVELIPDGTPSFYVSFNPNDGGGVLEERKVYYGLPYLSSYPSLPTPTRTGYTFNGWYTEASGGTLITGDSIVSIADNHSLYAQWTPNTYTVNFNPNGGTINSGKVTS